MQTKSVKMLPKTSSEIQNGGVYSQSVRCGKRNCKCARGETHTAFYFFTRINGKLVKFYVRKAQVEQFTELAQRATAERRHLRQITRSDLELLKQLRENLREKDSLIKLLKGA